MSSGLDMPSGRMRGTAATHVLNRSILGFLSPLSRRNTRGGTVRHHGHAETQRNTTLSLAYKFELEFVMLMNIVIYINITL